MNEVAGETLSDLRGGFGGGTLRTHPVVSAGVLRTAAAPDGAVAPLVHDTTFG